MLELLRRNQDRLLTFLASFLNYQDIYILSVFCNAIPIQEQCDSGIHTMMRFDRRPTVLF